MYARQVIVFGRHSHGDYLPLLAVQDGLLGEMVRQCRSGEEQADALGYLMGELWPNACWGDVRG